MFSNGSGKRVMGGGVGWVVYRVMNEGDDVEKISLYFTIHPLFFSIHCFLHSIQSSYASSFVVSEVGAKARGGGSRVGQRVRNYQFSRSGAFARLDREGGAPIEMFEM